MTKVRIVRRPEGEAPAWVREAWIGLELPVLDSQPISTFGYGVLTGPRNLVLDWIWHFTGRSKVLDGFRIQSDVAVDILEQSSPDAARWWRENAALPYGAVGNSSLTPQLANRFRLQDQQ